MANSRVEQYSNVFVHRQHRSMLILLCICPDNVEVEATHHTRKRSHKCKGYIVQRTVSSRSPSSCSCLSECSLVWVGRSSSYPSRWSCMSHSVHSRGFQSAPAYTFLKGRSKSVNVDTGSENLLLLLFCCGLWGLT